MGQEIARREVNSKTKSLNMLSNIRIHCCKHPKKLTRNSYLQGDDSTKMSFLLFFGVSKLQYKAKLKHITSTKKISRYYKTMEMIEIRTIEFRVLIREMTHF